MSQRHERSIFLTSETHATSYKPTVPVENRTTFYLLGGTMSIFTTF